jgi:hypothetical protein
MKMNRFESITKPLQWIMALVLVAFVAGCGGGGGGGTAMSSSKAITAFSLAAVSGVPASTATTITGTKSPFAIAVTMPNGTTDLTALVATYTANGASSVKVGTTVQTTGFSRNDFSAASGVAAIPVPYLVTAADASTATYNVTVNVAAATTGPVVVCSGVQSTTSPACVPLGKAANFAILSKAGITDTPASPITGNIGTSGITGASITVPCTDMLTGQVYTDDANYPGFTCTASDKTMASLAVLDMGTAATDAAGRTVPAPSVLASNISGLNLAPGIWKTSTDVLINTPGVTLTGNSTDVWIFQIAGNLTVGSGAIVTLSGGALPQNVFWQVGGVSGATLGTTADFKGIILSSKQIAMQSGAKLTGRALAQSQVTLSTSTVTQP